MSEKYETNALDELIQGSQRYKKSKDYIEMMTFISRFKKYSLFNYFLIHNQNRNASYVATEKHWWKKLKRKPKRNANPMIILAPMHPVLFVYDLQDTEGESVPEILIRPFLTKGVVNPGWYRNIIANAWLWGICIKEDPQGHFEGGEIRQLQSEERMHFKDLFIQKEAKYLVRINQNHNLEDQFSSLVHELGHFFCGHLGTAEEAWWPGRQELTKDEREFEAESVSYLLCRRLGLWASSEKYLSGYISQWEEIPKNISLKGILKSTEYIEKMTETIWKKPKWAKVDKNKSQ